MTILTIIVALEGNKANRDGVLLVQSCQSLSEIRKEKESSVN